MTQTFWSQNHSRLYSIVEFQTVLIVVDFCLRFSLFWLSFSFHCPFHNDIQQCAVAKSTMTTKKKHEVKPCLMKCKWYAVIVELEKEFSIWPHIPIFFFVWIIETWFKCRMANLTCDVRFRIFLQISFSIFFSSSFSTSASLCSFQIIFIIINDRNEIVQIF